MIHYLHITQHYKQIALANSIATINPAILDRDQLYFTCIFHLFFFPKILLFFTYYTPALKINSNMCCNLNLKELNKLYN